MKVDFEKEDKTFAVIGAAMAVHTNLGTGFLENVYHEALMLEFNKRKIPYIHEAELPIFYERIKLNCKYRVDFICFDDVLVEIKALNSLTNIETSQVINYLKAAQVDKALLLNFGASSLQYKRLNNSKS